MNKTEQNKDIYILGLSCFYHDSAACLLKNGEIISAAQEERFTRKKQDEDFPEKAIEYCFNHAGITIDDITHIGFYEKPFIKFERLLKTYIKTWPISFVSFYKAMKVWLKQKLWIPSIIKKKLNYKGDILYINHHLSHAASSFLSSPFKESAILTVDGVGEWDTTTYGYGEDNKVNLTKRITFPHSLGLLYSAFTYYLGFKVNSAEYKVMGLAPYGEPKYVDKVKEVIDIKEDGSYALKMKYFAYDYGLRMTNFRFHKLFGGPPRKPESKLTQREFDIAKSLQTVLEEILVKMGNHIHKETGKDYLCMAGGVALNCVANEKILANTPFKKIYVQPASGDAGGAAGVALYIYNSILNKPRKYEMDHVYLGPSYKSHHIYELLLKHAIPHKRVQENELYDEIADKINNQKVIGWFQGRMEYGPRALGNRSILADARNEENWQRVNLKIKFRESFRPFAPTALAEEALNYFDIPKTEKLESGHPASYMLITSQGKKKGIPAVTHKDNSARIQTVAKDVNPRYWNLINKFHEKTGTPVIINTSFNVRGEPIVCTPEDALKCFLRTQMDILVMHNFIIDKKDISKELYETLGEQLNFDEKFEMD